MDAADIRAADAEARQRFTYVADGTRDTWRSHADAVLRGLPWRGDCDDLASTVLDLLGRRGLPLDRRWRLAVDSSGDGRVDHLIGCVADVSGRFWIVGDTFGPAHPMEHCRHRIVQHNRLDERFGGRFVWREGSPAA